MGGGWGGVCVFIRGGGWLMIIKEEDVPQMKISAICFF